MTDAEDDYEYDLTLNPVSHETRKVKTIGEKRAEQALLTMNQITKDLERKIEQLNQSEERWENVKNLVDEFEAESPALTAQNFVDRIRAWVHEEQDE